MIVTLNNQDSNGIYMFDRQPNIVSYEANDFSGSPAQMVITIPNGLTDGETGMTIEINGETITSCVSQADAGPREFMVSSVGLTTANNVCSALLNIASLNTNYDIYFNTDQYGYGVVILMARQLGESFDLSGSCSDVSVDIVSTPSNVQESASKAILRISADGKYWTSLDKLICSKLTRFDISPVVESLTTYGGICQLTLDCWTSDVNGTITKDKTFNASVIKGYHTEGQPLYLTGGGLLQNVQGTLYTYDGNLQFSYLNPSGYEVACTIKTRDSAFGLIDSDSYDFEGEGIVDCNFNVASLMTGETFYIDVELPNDVLLRYNVIKPSRMTEGAVRICFRNSMGGISFVDMTGKASKKNSISFETYHDEGSSYNYYLSGMRYDKLKASAENDIEYTLRSHIMRADSLFIFEDLARSERAWIGDEMILVSDITYNEQSNNTYVVEVKYKRSRIN